MTTVRCVGCFREEQWDADGHHVRIPGGQRRPAEAAPLAAWRIVARSLGGELGTVVGECAACGLPLTAERGSALAPWSWRFDLPDGAVTAEGGVLHPPTPPAALTARLEALHRRPLEIRPAIWLFQGSVISLLAVPFALWIFGMIFVVFFLVNFW